VDSHEPIRRWSGSNWEIALEQKLLRVVSGGSISEIPLDSSVTLIAKRKWFRWHLHSSQGMTFKLKGIGRFDAKLIALSIELSQARIWATSVQGILNSHKSKQQWIPLETIENWTNSKPSPTLRDRIDRLGLKRYLSQQEHESLDFLVLDTPKIFETTNQEILDAELMSQTDFLKSVESQPLTLEQSKAVIMVDNRVLLVAAAGSGKTSVMVARAAYATMKGTIDPSRILLLAFNTAAAAELKERIISRFAKAGLNPEGIEASTFHSFGLSVLGKSLLARPKVAPWVDKGADLEEINNIVTELRKSTPDFGYNWDLYRLIFTPDTLRISGVEPDWYEPKSKIKGFRTFDGKLVRSHGERMIANWLYLNGVSYEYERDYKFKTADRTHRQYMPDFYYPQIDVWHEHWALDINGHPPKEFSGYVQDMAWKRNIHKEKGTDLIETTFGQVVYSNGLTILSNELLARGISLNWDPDRAKAPFTEVENSELVSLIRSFMTHVKSNSLTAKDLDFRLSTKWSYLKSARSDLFLKIFWPIYEEWNRRLAAASAIDFEDMLVRSAELIESGSYTVDFDMILVDEFQDSSTARARLVNALLNAKGKYLLAVGDDWQSINRFAGADVSLMTRFHDIFGHGPRLVLSRTFRCTQIIADVATKFVSKNPGQIQKAVLSEFDGQNHPVTYIRSNNPQIGVLEALERIARDVLETGKSKASVYVLGRYRFNRDWMPDRKFEDLEISYKTIHGSKGLEADYVVLVNFEAGRHGFPSEIEDDPILDLSMTEPETFVHAEERRLLYVALTRAREQVFLVARENMDSIFAAELVGDQLVDVVSVDADGSTPQILRSCSKCNQGVIVIKTGRYGPFLGCSRFPKCLNNPKI
jgi:DNA helicase-4